MRVFRDESRGPLWMRIAGLLLAGLFCPQILSAQQLAAVSYSTEEGLAHPQVWSVLQDTRGYLWAGTTEGASRYDGLSFETIAARDGLKSQTIRTMIEDLDGRIWFGTEDGVAVYEGRAVKAYTGEGFPAGTIWASARDDAGRLWFGTQYGGVAMFDGSRFHFFSTEQGLASQYVYSLLADSNGQLWLGHRGEGVTRCRIDSGGALVDCANFSVSDGLSNGEVRAIVEWEGNIYFGTRGGGVNRFDGHSFDSFSVDQGLGESDIYALAVNGRSDLVVGTVNRGISICDMPDLARCRSFGIGNGLPDDGVLSMTIDRDDVLWIGFENGLSRVGTERMMSFTTSDGLPHKTVYALAAESDGSVWVGTLGGLARVTPSGDRQHPDRMETWKGGEDLPGEEVWDLLLDKAGRLWVATEKGLCQFEAERGCVRVFDEEDGLAAADMISLSESARGEILVTHIEGVSILTVGPKGELRSVRNVTLDEGLAGSFAYAIVEDRYSRIWLGTDQGLSGILGDDVVSFTTENGLPANEIFAMHGGEDGRIWFGTNGGGVVSFTPPPPGAESEVRFESYELGDMVPDSVAAIDAAPDGRLWIGTNDGVFLFDPSAQGKDRIRFEFDKESGLVSNEVNVFTTDAKGRLWVGVSGGVSRFDPSIPQQDAKPPRMAIERVRTSGGPEWRRPFTIPSVLRDPGVNWLEGSSLKIAPGLSSLRFEYRGLSFRERGHVRFQVQLEGFEPGWSLPSRELFKEYTNLDPGQYTFRVRASNRDGKWGKPAELGIVIRAAWWQTRWFAGGVAAGVGFLLIAGYRVKTYTINARNRELEIAVSERTEDLQRYARALEEHSRALDRANVRIREADRVKSEFLANMSHELRTPLNSIIGFSDVLIPRFTGRAEDREMKFLRNVQSSGRYLLLLINNLLDLSKIEAGSVDLILERADLQLLVETTCSVVQGYAEERNITVNYDVTSEIGEIVVDVPKFKQILLNLLSNAVKFSRPGGKVDVYVRPRAASESVLRVDSYELEVTDEGSGIRVEDQELIFEEFRQVGLGSTHPGGTGLGLALVRRFVSLLGGEVTLESTPEIGSTFRVILPVEVRMVAAVDLPGELAHDSIRPRVLMIESRPRAFGDLTTLLDREGFLPVRTHETAEALRIAGEVHPSAIVFDLELAGFDGWDVFAALNEDGRSADIPLILCVLDRDALLSAVGSDAATSRDSSSEEIAAVVTYYLDEDSGSGRRVLAVTQDISLLDRIASSVGKLDCEMVRAASCAEALDEAVKKRPSLLLIDLMMPDRAGLDAVKRVQRDHRTKHIPIVLLVDLVADRAARQVVRGDLAEARESEASFQELSIAVHELIRRRSSREVRVAAAGLAKVLRQR